MSRRNLAASGDEAGELSAALLYQGMGGIRLLVQRRQFVEHIQQHIDPFPTKPLL